MLTEDRDARRKLLSELIDHLDEAFRELHEAVLAEAAKPARYIDRHHEYPKMRWMDSGFPHFSESGFYDQSAPQDFVGVFRPRSLLGAFRHRRPDAQFPLGAKLVEFLKTSPLAARFDFSGLSGGHEVDAMLAAAVERYLHLYGLGPIDKVHRNAVLFPLYSAIVKDSLPVSLVVPITMTHFEVPWFRFTDTTYITRIPAPMQLARSTMKPWGTGAVEMVIGAATHAFVASGWSIPNDTIQRAREGLNKPSANVLDEVEEFFASLRAATGITTGYAQVLFVPRGWGIDYLCELPTFYGSTYRRYPNEFDAYGWVNGDHPVLSRAQLQDVARVYRLVLERREERMTIALRRLNACLTRSDPVDAILDATIGLEVLLGDKENLALSYKLRMRAGALAGLRPGGPDSAEVAAQVKKVYDIRSKIVHGLTSGKATKTVAEPAIRYTQERAQAADLLRLVIDLLLEHPRYLKPEVIDDELLLGPKDSAATKP